MVTQVQPRKVTRCQERLKNGIERLVFLRMRLRHRARASAKYKARTEAIDSVRRFFSRVAGMNIERIKRVYNLVFYLLLVDQDLADFADSLIFATGDRRRAFFAKHEAVLVYEAADDLRSLMGRDFREALKSFGTTDKQFAEINKACSALKSFWDDHHQFLNSIRNALAAHRERDALQYVENWR